MQRRIWLQGALNEWEGRWRGGGNGEPAARSRLGARRAHVRLGSPRPPTLHHSVPSVPRRAAVQSAAMVATLPQAQMACPSALRVGLSLATPALPATPRLAAPRQSKARARSSIRLPAALEWPRPGAWGREGMRGWWAGALARPSSVACSASAPAHASARWGHMMQLGRVRVLV